MSRSRVRFPSPALNKHREKGLRPGQKWLEAFLSFCCQGYDNYSISSCLNDFSFFCHLLGLGSPNGDSHSYSDSVYATVQGQSSSGGSETQNFCYNELNQLIWAGNPAAAIAAAPNWPTRSATTAIAAVLPTPIWANSGKGRSTEPGHPYSISTAIAPIRTN